MALLKNNVFACLTRGCDDLATSNFATPNLATPDLASSDLYTLENKGS